MKTRKKLISTNCSTQNCKTPYEGMRGVTRIHVNQHNVRDNQKDGTNLPIVTVKKGKQNVYGHVVEVEGPSVVVYRPGKPLNCGARVWIETVSTVRIIEHALNGGSDKVTQLKGNNMIDANQELKDLEASLDSGASTEALQQAAQQAQEAAEVIVEEGADTGLFEVPNQETPAQMTKRWVKYGEEHLKNQTIKAVRYLTKNEASGLGWQSRPIVLELDNGTLLLPSSDDEGNDGGALIGNTKSGKELTFPVLWR
jgi:hypothetical protein